MQSLAFHATGNGFQADWRQLENRSLLRGMLMTACDVAAITKPWEVQKRVAELVASEFFDQGDQERDKFSSAPIPMMDREKQNELPKMQVGFIDFVCMPLYKVFYHINPRLKPFYDGVLDNRKNWQDAADNGYQPVLLNKKGPLQYNQVLKIQRQSVASFNSKDIDFKEGANIQTLRDKKKSVHFEDDKSSKFCSLL